MIKEVKGFVIECDSCKGIFEDYNGMSVFVDEATANEYVTNESWIEKDGKLYCTDCYFIDANDEIVLDKDRFDTFTCTNCQNSIKLPPNDRILKGEVVGYCIECGHVIWK